MSEFTVTHIDQMNTFASITKFHDFHQSSYDCCSSFHRPKLDFVMTNIYQNQKIETSPKLLTLIVHHQSLAKQFLRLEQHHPTLHFP